MRRRASLPPQHVAGSGTCPGPGLPLAEGAGLQAASHHLQGMGMAGIEPVVGDT